MHELSIAQNIVEIASQHLRDLGTVRVESIRLKIGALSCVHRESLLFSFDLVAADSPLAGARLEIETLPIMIFCSTCNTTRELPSIQSFRCPQCGTPSADIRQGRELDIDSIECTELHSPTESLSIPEEAAS